MRRTSKYGSKKITMEGETFDSLKEYRRFCELKLLERAGKITNLHRQVKYTLIPTQYEPDIIGERGGRKKGKLIERECAYIADFVYEVRTSTQYTDDDGNLVFADGFKTVVEDTKGFRTTEYIIKRKLMLWVHGIRISEI